MTPLTETLRRVTAEKYGHGRQARKLVVAFERGDLIAIHELRRRTVYRARLSDGYWWMLRCQTDKLRMERCVKSRPAKPPGSPAAASATLKEGCFNPAPEPKPARGSSYHEPVIHRVRR
jgi:hypothetical protein